jgi:putative inorganic carbon (HCO3(-)) transporter
VSTTTRPPGPTPTPREVPTTDPDAVGSGPHAGTGRRHLGSRVAAVGGALVAAAAAAVSGLATLGTSPTWVYLPLLAGIGVALGMLALTRFAGFVYLLLLTRTGLDLLKLSGPAAGNTSTNTAASRGLDPSTLVGLLVVVAGTLWLIAQYSRPADRSLGGRPPASRLRVAWIALIVAAVLSLFGSQNPLVSLIGITRLLAVAVMFLVLEQLVRDAKSVRTAIAVAFGSLVIPLTYTAFGFVSGHPAADVKSSFVRITGPFTQSTTFARYLAFLIVFGVAILPYVKGRARVALVGGLSLSSVFLLLTLTRGALLATVLGLLAVVVLQRRWKLLLGLGAAGLLALTLVPGLGSRLDAVTQERAVGQAPTSNSLEWRLSYWAETLPLADRQPVNGIGYDMTQYKTDVAKQPHNDFIKAYVETGILGLGAYLYLCWQIVVIGLRAVRRTVVGTWGRAVAAGYLACAGMFVLQSVAANVISSVVVLWYLAVFAAAALAVTRLPEVAGPVRRSRAPRAATPDLVPSVSDTLEKP